MSGGNDTDEAGDKPHEPTPKKLEQARKKGQIPRSQDLNTAAAYAGLLLAALALGGWSTGQIGRAAQALIDRPDRLAEALFGSAQGLVGGLMAEVALGAAPWFALPALAVLVAIWAQRGFLFTGENLAPRLSRISPIAAAKQKFGRSGLFEFAKSAAKLTITGAVLAWYLSREMDRILGLARVSPGMVALESGRLITGFLTAVVVVAGLIAALDYLWQHFEHIRRNRMSMKELRDEVKDAEGDPYMKHERRRRGMDIATNRMLAEVPKADVVIVNPSHFAVALKWSRMPGAAPVCVAKGVDEIAARIREAAAEAGVPIHRDPPTARALHATVELEAEIRPEQYRAVAAAIRFAERMRAEARRRGR